MATVKQVVPDPVAAASIAPARAIQGPAPGALTAEATAQIGQQVMQDEAREDNTRRSKDRREMRKEMTDVFAKHKEDHGFETKDGVEAFDLDMEEIRTRFSGAHADAAHHAQSGEIFAAEVETASGQFEALATQTYQKASFIAAEREAGEFGKQMQQFARENPDQWTSISQSINDYVDNNYAPGRSPDEIAEKRKALHGAVGESLVKQRIILGDTAGAKALLKDEEITSGMTTAMKETLANKVTVAEVVTTKELAKRQANAAFFRDMMNIPEGEALPERIAAAAMGITLPADPTVIQKIDAWERANGGIKAPPDVVNRIIFSDTSRRVGARERIINQLSEKLLPFAQNELSPEEDVKVVLNMLEYSKPNQYNQRAEIPPAYKQALRMKGIKDPEAFLRGGGATTDRIRNWLATGSDVEVGLPAAPGPEVGAGGVAPDPEAQKEAQTAKAQEITFDWEAADTAAEQSFQLGGFGLMDPDAPKTGAGLWQVVEDLTGPISGTEVLAGRFWLSSWAGFDSNAEVAARGHMAIVKKSIVLAMQNNPKFNEGERLAIVEDMNALESSWWQSYDDFRSKLTGLDRGLLDLQMNAKRTMQNSSVSPQEHKRQADKFNQIQQARELLRVPATVSDEATYRQLLQLGILKPGDVYLDRDGAENDVIPADLTWAGGGR